MTVQDLIRHQARGGKKVKPPAELELEELEAEQQAIAPADLTYIQKHTLPIIQICKPRLSGAKRKLMTNAPLCILAPHITGTGTVGQTLTCSAGSWQSTPAPTYTYVWLRAGNVISGATAGTYVLVAGDSGNQIHARVTATNVNGVTTERSDNTITVA